MADDPLRDFERTEFTHDGSTKTVYRQGEGPAVIVIAEAPGITPKVAEFARRLPAIGCTAVMPHLFGVPGRDTRMQTRGKARALVELVGFAARVCVSNEFVVFARGRTSPVVDWLRALAGHEHERCGGPGVGAVGMCFTGGYALAMAADDRLLVPVLSQPSMPAGLTAAHRRSIDIDAAALATVKTRCGAGLDVIGLRFEEDPLCPPERFEYLREELGEAFIGVELPQSTANPAAETPPHSVLTEHLIDQPGEPTHDALTLVLDHLQHKLGTRAGT